MILQEAILLLFYMNFIKCELKKEASKSKNPLPYFRREVEGLPEDSSLKTFPGDLDSNLVSLLVKNVKEIFDDINENEVEVCTSSEVIKSSTASLNADSLNPTYLMQSSQDDTTFTFAVMPNENLPLTTLIDYQLNAPLSDKTEIEKTIRSELMHLTKDLKNKEKSDINVIKRDDSIGANFVETPGLNNTDDSKRSCISCSNVMYENCNEPLNKIIPTISCGRDGDLCFSQHTPFGVINRGCYNVNHNLATYVCSCNLCNYISISEMPYIFSNKQDWIDNVIELTRTRNFRKSVFKDMACLRCEVNTSTKIGDMLNNANCLEGNIGNLPIQECVENEICAVRAVRSDGYIWRGCLPAPLYNHWWALCDSDLCNSDSLVYIYDYI